MCRRLRFAMVNPTRDPLTGVVEMGDIYVAGVEKGIDGRQTRTKIIVVVAVENRGEYAGRVRMQILTELSWRVIRQFFAANIAPGSEVRTEGVSFYKYGDWKALGLRYILRVQRAPERAGRLLPWVHQITGNLKAWLRGTHHGRMERQHPHAYLDEFTFRFNRRHYREHGFLTLLLLSTKRRSASSLTGDLLAQGYPSA